MIYLYALQRGPFFESCSYREQREGEKVEIGTVNLLNTLGIRSLPTFIRTVLSIQMFSYFVLYYAHAQAT